MTTSALRLPDLLHLLTRHVDCGALGCGKQQPVLTREGDFSSVCTRRDIEQGCARGTHAAAGVAWVWLLNSDLCL